MLSDSRQKRWLHSLTGVFLILCPGLLLCSLPKGNFSVLAPQSGLNPSRQESLAEGWPYSFLKLSMEEILKIASLIADHPVEEQLEALRIAAEHRETHFPSLRHHAAAVLVFQKKEQLLEGSIGYTQEEWTGFFRSMDQLSGVGLPIELSGQVNFCWVYYGAKAELLTLLVERGFELDSLHPPIALEHWRRFLWQSLAFRLFTEPENTSLHASFLKKWLALYQNYRQASVEDPMALISSYLFAGYYGYINKDMHLDSEELAGVFRDTTQEISGRSLLEDLTWLVKAYARIGAHQDAIYFFDQIPRPEDPQELIQYYLLAVDLFSSYYLWLREEEGESSRTGVILARLNGFMIHLEQYENNNPPLVRKGRVLHRFVTGDYDRTVEEGRKMVAQGADVEILFLLSRAYLETGRTQEAGECFKLFLNQQEHERTMTPNQGPTWFRFLISTLTPGGLQEREEFFQHFFPLFQASPMRPAARMAVLELFQAVGADVSFSYLSAVGEELWQTLRQDPLDAEKARSLIQFLGGLDGTRWVTILLAEVQFWVDHQLWLERQTNLQGQEKSERARALEDLQSAFRSNREKYRSSRKAHSERVFFFNRIRNSLQSQIGRPVSDESTSNVPLRALLHEWAKLDREAEPTQDSSNQYTLTGTIDYWQQIVFYLSLTWDSEYFDFLLEEGMRIEEYLLGQNGREGRLDTIARKIRTAKNARGSMVFTEAWKNSAHQSAALLHLIQAMRGGYGRGQWMDRGVSIEQMRLGLGYLDSATEGLKNLFIPAREIDPEILTGKWATLAYCFSLFIDQVMKEGNFSVRALQFYEDLELYDGILKRVRNFYSFSKEQWSMERIPSWKFPFVLLTVDKCLRLTRIFSSPGRMSQWLDFVDETERDRQRLLSDPGFSESMPQEREILLTRRIDLLVPYLDPGRIWEWESFLDRALEENPEGHLVSDEVPAACLHFIKVLNFLEVSAAQTERGRIISEREKVARRILEVTEKYDLDQQLFVTLEQRAVALMVLNDFDRVAEISDPLLRAEGRFVRLIARIKRGEDVYEELRETLKETSYYSVNLLEPRMMKEVFEVLAGLLARFRLEEDQDEAGYLLVLAGFHQMLADHLFLGFLTENEYVVLTAGTIRKAISREGRFLGAETMIFPEMLVPLKKSESFLTLQALEELSNDPRIQKSEWQSVHEKLQEVIAAIRENIARKLRKQIRDAYGRIALEEARGLFGQLEVAGVKLSDEEIIQKKRLEILLEAWDAYQRGEEALALQETDQFSSRDDVSRAVKGYLRRVIEAHRWFSRGRWDEAESLLEQIGRRPGMEDPRYDLLRKQITEHRERYDRLSREVEELRQSLLQKKTSGTEIADLERLKGRTEDLLSVLAVDLRALEILFEVSRRFYRAGDLLSEQNHPLDALEALRAAHGTASGLSARLDAIEKNPPVSSKPKSEIKVYSTSENAFKERVTSFHRRAKARVVLETMVIHQRVLESMITAEKAMEKRLEKRFRTIRWRFDRLRKTEDGFWIQRFIKPNRDFRVEEVFSAGDSYWIYDPGNGNGNSLNGESAKVSNTYFRVAQIQRATQQVRFEVIGEEDAKIALAMLPERGVLERVPNAPAKIQHECLTALIHPLRICLQESVRTERPPSVGNRLLDYLLGLEFPQEQQTADLPVTLIQGPSGTGKTQVILAMAMEYLGLDPETYGVALDSWQSMALRSAVPSLPGALPGQTKILIVSQSNAAVDNVGIRMQQKGIPFIRVGNNEASVAEELRAVWFHREELLEEAKRAYREEGKGFVILATNIGYQTDLHIRKDSFFRELKFDVVIIEEAPRATLGETLVAARLAQTKLVAVGDHRQLPPYAVDNSEIKRIQQELPRSDWEAVQELLSPEGVSLLKTSPFETAFEEPDQKTVERFTLRINRRMEQLLARFVSFVFYGGLIQPDSDKDPLTRDQEKGILQILNHSYPESSVILEDGNEEGNFSRANVKEAALTVQKAVELLSRGNHPRHRAGYKPEEILILTPYKANVALIKETITLGQERGDLSPEEAAILRGNVKTVDEIQGSENEAVLVALVRSNPQSNIGFLTDLHRLLVSLSRQRKELTIIGNFQTFQNARYIPREISRDARRQRWEEQRQQETAKAAEVYRQIFQFVRAYGTVHRIRERTWSRRTGGEGLRRELLGAL